MIVKQSPLPRNTLHKIIEECKIKNAHIRKPTYRELMLAKLKLKRKGVKKQ